MVDYSTLFLALAKEDLKRQIKKIPLKREAVLKKALELIKGNREESYGNPKENFGKIASLWSTYLGMEVTPRDVANLMILLKVSRDSTGKPKEDNMVDIIGYAALGAEVEGA